MGSFCNASKPHAHYTILKGKGAEVKDLLPAVCKIWRERARDFAKFDAVDNTMQALLAMQNILRSHSEEVILPLSAAKQVEEHVDAFLTGYQQLAYEVERDGELLWNFPSKFHWLHHMSRKARFLNPRKTNTFLDEDFVGKVKVLAHSTAPGTELHAMLPKMFDRCRWALHFE